MYLYCTYIVIEAIHLHRYSWGGYSRVSYSGIFLDIDFLLLCMYSKLVKKPQTLVLATQFGPTTVWRHTKQKIYSLAPKIAVMSCHKSDFVVIIAKDICPRKTKIFQQTASHCHKGGCTHHERWCFWNQVNKSNTLLFNKFRIQVQ